MSGNISLCSPHTQQTQQTMNGRGECLLDACECITSVKKKKEMVVVFLLSFSSTWQAHAHYSSFVFFTVSSFNSLYFVQCFALFFFFRKCVQKSTAVVPSWWLCSSKNRCRVHHVQLFFLSLFFLFLRVETKKKKRNKTKWRESTYKKKKRGRPNNSGWK